MYAAIKSIFKTYLQLSHCEKSQSDTVFSVPTATFSLFSYLETADKICQPRLSFQSSHPAKLTAAG